MDKCLKFKVNKRKKFKCFLGWAHVRVTVVQ